MHNYSHLFEHALNINIHYVWFIKQIFKHFYPVFNYWYKFESLTIWLSMRLIKRALGDSFWLNAFRLAVRFERRILHFFWRKMGVMLWILWIESYFLDYLQLSRDFICHGRRVQHPLYPRTDVLRLSGYFIWLGADSFFLKGNIGPDFTQLILSFPSDEIC